MRGHGHKTAEVIENSEFHNRAVLISSVMGHLGWKCFLEQIQDRKKKIIEYIVDGESGVEFVGVERKGANISVIVFNKSEIQHELKFLQDWETKFKEWQMEAAGAVDESGR